MAISNVTPRVLYTADGSNPKFSITFELPANITSGNTITDTKSNITSGSNVLTTGTSNVFYDSSNLVGKSITIVGAGTGGANLQATINTVTNSEAIVINTDAITTVTNATIVVTTGQTGTTIRNNGDIIVSVDGVAKTIGTDYNVELNIGDSVSKKGNVIFASAPANTSVVTLQRDIEVERTTDFQTGGALTAENLNKEFDQMLMSVQDQAVDSDLALKFAATDEISLANTQMPNTALRINKALVFDANGNPTVSGDFTAGNITANIIGGVSGATTVNATTVNATDVVATNVNASTMTATLSQGNATFTNANVTTKLISNSVTELSGTVKIGEYTYPTTGGVNNATLRLNTTSNVFEIANAIGTVFTVEAGHGLNTNTGSNIITTTGKIELDAKVENLTDVQNGTPGNNTFLKYIAGSDNKYIPHSAVLRNLDDVDLDANVSNISGNSILVYNTSNNQFHACSEPQFSRLTTQEIKNDGNITLKSYLGVVGNGGNIEIASNGHIALTGLPRMEDGTTANADFSMVRVTSALNEQSGQRQGMSLEDQIYFPAAGNINMYGNGSSSVYIKPYPNAGAVEVNLNVTQGHIHLNNGNVTLSNGSCRFIGNLQGTATNASIANFIPSISNAQDVSVIGLANGDVLEYNGTSVRWEAKAPVRAVGDLSDVDSTGVTNGQALVYISANNRFEPGAVSSGGGTGFDGTANIHVADGKGLLNFSGANTLQGLTFHTDGMHTGNLNVQANLTLTGNLQTPSGTSLSLITTGTNDEIIANAKSKIVLLSNDGNIHLESQNVNFGTLATTDVNIKSRNNANLSIQANVIDINAQNNIAIMTGADDLLTLGSDRILLGENDNTSINIYNWNSDAQLNIMRANTGNDAKIEFKTNDLVLTPNTTSGQIVLDGLNWPTADGTANQVLKTDGAGQLSFTTVSGAGGSGISNLVEDTTPELGGDLDVKGFAINAQGSDNITLNADADVRVWGYDDVQIWGQDKAEYLGGNIQIKQSSGNTNQKEGINISAAEGNIIIRQRNTANTKHKIRLQAANDIQLLAGDDVDISAADDYMMRMFRTNITSNTYTGNVVGGSNSKIIVAGGIHANDQTITSNAGAGYVNITYANGTSAATNVYVESANSTAFTMESSADDNSLVADNGASIFFHFDTYEKQVKIDDKKLTIIEEGGVAGGRDRKLVISSDYYGDYNDGSWNDYDDNRHRIPTQFSLGIKGYKGSLFCNAHQSYATYPSGTVQEVDKQIFEIRNRANQNASWTSERIADQMQMFVPLRMYNDTTTNLNSNLGSDGEIAYDTTTNKFVGRVNGSTVDLGSDITASSIGESGYIKFSNGLILQWGLWGTFGGTVSTGTVTFPIAFPNNRFTVTTGLWNGNSTGLESLVLKSDVSKTGFTWYQNDTAQSGRLGAYMATGN